MSFLRNSYFFGISLVLFALVFGGFAPTFFLRPFFDGQDLVSGSQLPIHLIFHGLALTSWYSIFCIQTWLVYNNKTSRHRKLGLYGVIAAVCTVISGFFVLVKFNPRRLEAGIEIPADAYEEILASVNYLIIGQSINLLLFSVCVSLAVNYRKQSELHKRLMLIGSIIIMGAALSTDRYFGAAAQALLPFSFETTVKIFLVVSLLAYDWLEYKKILLISFIGGACILGKSLLVTLIAQSEAGIKYTMWLGFPAY